jgi:hypothetical protein
VSLRIALVRIVDKESAMLVEQQRFWLSVERQQAPGSRRCVPVDAVALRSLPSCLRRQASVACKLNFQATLACLLRHDGRDRSATALLTGFES